MNNTGMNFGGGWTEQKLECVTVNICNAYTTIMNNAVCINIIMPTLMPLQELDIVK